MIIGMTLINHATGVFVREPLGSFHSQSTSYKVDQLLAGPKASILRVAYQQPRLGVRAPSGHGFWTGKGKPKEDCHGKGTFDNLRNPQLSWWSLVLGAK